MVIFSAMTRVIRLPDPLSQNLSHLKASETIAISAEAKRRKASGEDVLDLGVGEPDFDTPAPVAQAGILAIQHGHTRYPPNAGLRELREAVAHLDLAHSEGKIALEFKGPTEMYKHLNGN